MRLPHLPRPRLTRTVLKQGGMASRAAADVCVFSHTENLITEGGRTRTHPPRVALTAPVSGDGLAVIHTAQGDQLCYPEGHDLIVGTQRHPMALCDTAHRLIPFGDMLLVFPERQYLRLSDGTCGMLDAELTTDGATLFTLCRADGSAYMPLTVSSVAPADPAHGDIWLDTAFKPILLRSYNAARQDWQTVTDTCLRISSPGIGRPFRVGDTVRLSNIIPAELKQIEGLHRLIACGEDHLVISAPPCVTLRQVAPLSVSRRMPDVDPDTLLLWRDRLVGAVRTVDTDGTAVTLFCASRAGDPFNWESTDEEDGAARRWRVAHTDPITASAVYRGIPHFFSEHGVLTLTGEGTSARWRLTPLAGVMSGCGESLQAVGDALYYRARRGMMRYDGRQVTALPALPRDPLPRAAAAGVIGDRYYLSLTRESGEADLLVYHVGDETWSRLDHTRAAHFLPYRGGLCYRDGCDGTVRAMEAPSSPADTSEVRWMAKTVPIRIRDQESGRLFRLELTLTLSAGGKMQILMRDGEGTLSCPIEISGQDDTLQRICIHPRAADRISLELRGRGEVTLHELIAFSR